MGPFNPVYDGVKIVGKKIYVFNLKETEKIEKSVKLENQKDLNLKYDFIDNHGRAINGSSGSLISGSGVLH